MNFNLHFGELHSNNSINDKNNLFENYIPKCYKVKRILISFNCFSEYILNCNVQHTCLKTTVFSLVDCHTNLLQMTLNLKTIYSDIQTAI